MIHTYSLIHDDLPGMDNDDLRRGRPTNHKVFGEGVAILAGDGLLNAAMEIVLRESVRSGNMNGVRAAEVLARHAGVTGMIGGQTVDVTMEGSAPTEELVTYIHSHKTSDLLQAPMEMGMILAGCGPDQVEKGRCYGYHLGIAFQIVDDILDVTGNPELMGKNTGMDENKMTWVALRGVEQARRDAEDHIRQAVKALQGLPWDTSFFESIARENLSRAY
jgi:geranylgeranyl diphosphate synthase type II